jgi:Helix-turn-helix.
MKLNLNRVKAERIALGLTQEQVAKRMGWKTRVPYAKREAGIVPFGADELGLYVEALGISQENISIFFTDRVDKREQ